MDDLVRWLGKQLEEDERLARAATPGPWSRMGRRVLDPTPPSDRLGIGMAVGHAAADADFNETADHIVRHDPARVLREIDSKRAILALHTQSLRDGGCQVCDVPGGRRLRPDACTTVRMLASAYADRPGFREEWRP